jgi:hypothetical protein
MAGAAGGAALPAESGIVVGRVSHETNPRLRLRENHELLLLEEGLLLFSRSAFEVTGTAIGVESRKQRENENSTARPRRKTRRAAARMRGSDVQGPARPQNPGLGPALEGLGFHFFRPKPKP